ncbi:MAG: formiminoglutamase, partial [Halothiobacillaceae bacterium]
MFTPPDMALWQGRIDNEESPALRWHQQIIAWDGERALNGATVLLGFCCDEGVRRNQGRPGAYQGPTALRQALANLAYHQQGLSYDAGNVSCD